MGAGGHCALWSEISVGGFESGWRCKASQVRVRYKTTGLLTDEFLRKNFLNFKRIPNHNF